MHEQVFARRNEYGGVDIVLYVGEINPDTGRIVYYFVAEWADYDYVL